MAAQGKMPEAGDGARREAAPSAYGGGVIEAGRLVVLAKPLTSGASAGYYTPFAVVRFGDLPEELRRHIAGAVAHGAAAPAVLAPLRGEGDARYHAALPVDVVTRRQLPGLVPGPNHNDELVDEDGKVLNTSRLMQFQGLGVGDTVKGFRHAWMGPEYNSEPSNMAAQRGAYAYMGAFYDNGHPASEDAAPVVVALLPDNNHIVGLPVLAWSSDSDSLAFPREDALPFGNGRATTELDIYNYDGLLPPENVVPAAEALRATRPPTYTVQVRVDKAAGGEAGDQTALSAKEAADADAGHEHGSLSAVLGIVVASTAATALAAGTVGPAAALGLFTALVGGLSLAMASVRAGAP